MARLAGARALVQSYVKLGFPQAVDSDLALQSDIEGVGAQFLDPKPGVARPLPEQLTRLIDSWIERVEASTDSEPTPLIEKNLIGEVAGRSTKWATEIATQIKPYVEGKVAGFKEDETETEAVAEQSPLVESTLSRLQLTRDVLAESRAPSAETLTPGNDITTTEATVRGEVDPDDGVVESCAFEYGSTEFYGHSVACETIPGDSEKAVVVSAKIANWTPEGSFHERVVVKTWGGTSYGEDVKVQLAQSAEAPAGLVIASTDTPGATVGAFKAEELPAGVALPAGARQIVGSLGFTVNVTPGGSAMVKIELPPGGSAPTALYKLLHLAGGGEEYREIPASLYTIAGDTIELTLVDGGPDDEDGAVNGVIVDPLVPMVVTAQAPPPAGSRSATTTVTPPAATIAPPTATIASPVGDGVYIVGAHVKTKFACAEGSGGPGIASCVDSSGASHGAGKLNTAKPGKYTYTVTAKSRDGQSSRTSLHYTVVTQRECVSHRKVTVNVANHIKLPAGTTLKSSTLVLRGHVVAKLNGPAKATVVSFAGLHGGPYKVTLVATLSNGKTRKVAIVFRTCVPTPKRAARER
ncbi:MAG: choice-of-anchor U domain-containing protein [Solirubrobacteraceae bacterium]